MKSGGFSSKVGLIISLRPLVWPSAIMTEFLVGKRSGKSVSCCPAMVGSDSDYTDLPQ